MKENDMNKKLDKKRNTDFYLLYTAAFLGSCPGTVSQIFYKREITCLES